MTAKTEARFVYKETTSGMFLLRDRSPPLPGVREYHFDDPIAGIVDDILAEAKADFAPYRAHRAHSSAWGEVSHNQSLAIHALKDAALAIQSAHGKFGCPAQALATLQALTDEVTAYTIALCILENEAPAVGVTKSGEH